MNKASAPGLDEPGYQRADRRRFLGWMGKVGVTTIGVVASLAATSKTAEAANWACCSLALPNTFCKTNSSAQYICPTGYTMKTWTCCSGSAPFQRRYACGECTKGSNCSTGPFICSAGWTVNANGC
ncbi:hypothetical protein [Streptosporangium sp. NPDC087985]|uniref:hypothetical protein n=1 Tax=Streptosporangium sp. NPDC087985 TaxID=3366196 RepID=UPI00381264F8